MRFFVLVFVVMASACVSVPPETETPSAAPTEPQALQLRKVSDGSALIQLTKNDKTFSGLARIADDGRLSAALKPVQQAAQQNANQEYGVTIPVSVSGQIIGDVADLVLDFGDGAVATGRWRVEDAALKLPEAFTKATLTPGAWTRIDPPKNLKGPVRVRVKGKGSFIGGQFQSPPKAQAALTDIDNHVVGLAKFMFEKPPAWLPDYYDEDGAGVWLIDGDAPFYVYDIGEDLRDSLVDVAWGGSRPFDDFEFFCNPQVDLELSASQIARGESVGITVSAASDYGIRQISWSVIATPESSARGEAYPGLGETAVTQRSSLTLNTPGLYVLRASASAEGGGGFECRDTEVVEVMPDARKTYRVAYLLLSESDPADPVFQARLRRLNNQKQQVAREFRRATDFTGAADISYRTVVMAPPRDGVSNSDGDEALRQFYRDAVRNFYATHPDDFDFIAVFTDLPSRLEETSPGFVNFRDGRPLGSRHFTVRRAVSGFGMRHFDFTREWGSDGRLRGVGAITDIGIMRDSATYHSSRILLSLHEIFGHQWGVYASTLARGGSHYKVGIQSDTHTVLYAGPWVDNGDGTFSNTDVEDPEWGGRRIKFHPWTLYVAGMKIRAEVPESILLVTTTPPAPGPWEEITRPGTAATIRLQSIIDTYGDRRDH